MPEPKTFVFGAWDWTSKATITGSRELKMRRGMPHVYALCGLSVDCALAVRCFPSKFKHVKRGGKERRDEKTYDIT